MTTQQPPDGRRPVGPGIADAVFLFVMVVVLNNAAKGLLDDPGLGWHLRNIDAMRAEGGWLSLDPFTYPRGEAPRPWFTNQWLGELPLYLGWKAAGLEGIALASAVVIAAVARTLYRILVADGLPWPVALFWTALGTLGTSCSWVARPNLFTVLFVLVTARVLSLYHEGRTSRRGTLWLLPLFAAWANTHGGYLAGFIVVALSLAGEGAIAVASFDGEARRAARDRAGHLLLLLGGLFLATLANPYGLHLYKNSLALLGDRYFMELHLEWKSPDFHAAGTMRYELLMLLFPAVLAASRRRVALPELLTAVAFLHLALTGFRYVALWVVVAVPMMARASVEVPYLIEAARRASLTVAEGSPFFTRPWSGRWPWVVAAVLAGAAWAHFGAGGLKRQEQRRERLAETDDRTRSTVIVARNALDEFLEMTEQWRERHGRRPVVFHSYDWGGYLTWHGWRPGGDGLLNWIDDRNEVQGKDRVEEYKTILAARPGWEALMTDVDLVCVEAGAPLVEKLEAHPDWRKLPRRRDHPEDSLARLYERVRRP